MSNAEHYVSVQYRRGDESHGTERNGTERPRPRRLDYRCSVENQGETFTALTKRLTRRTTPYPSAHLSHSLSVD